MRANLLPYRDFLRLGLLGGYIIIAISLGSLAGCGATRGIASTHFEGSTVQVAIPGDASTLNPVISSSDEEFYIEEAIFDGLVKFDADGQLIPDLALAVPSRANDGISSDYKTITYHLRRDVRWQDGLPFTSRDVAFTYRLQTSDRVSSPLRSVYEQIASLDTPSPYTIVVHLRKPSLAAVSQIFVASTGSIVPEHILGHVQDVRRSDFNSSPVGTGPFALSSWKRGDELDLIANERYFGGRPHFRELRLRIVPDPLTRAQLVRAGIVDLAGVELSAVAWLKSSRGIRVVQRRSTNVFYLDLNLHRPPLDNRQVREALSAAIDLRRSSLMFGGRERPAYSLMPPAAGVPRCARDFDPNRLLNHAGWRTARGVRERAGARLGIQITYGSGPMMEAVALELRQAWRAIGVETTLRPLPAELVYGDRGLLARGRYDVAIDGMGIAMPGDIASIIATQSAPPGGFNDTRYANPNVDRWLAMASETNDARRRTWLYAKVQGALCHDEPVVPLFWGTHIDAFNARLHGFASEPIASDLWNVATWSLR